MVYKVAMYLIYVQSYGSLKKKVFFHNFFSHLFLQYWCIIHQFSDSVHLYLNAISWKIKINL